MLQKSEKSNLEIIRRHQLKFGVRFACWLLITTFSLIAPLYLPTEFLPFFSILLGLAIAHGIELQHQAIHYTGFRNRILNIISGNLLGLPTLNSFTHYQTLHNWHHQKIGTKDDIEFFNDHRIDVRLSPLNLSRFGTENNIATLTIELPRGENLSVISNKFLNPILEFIYEVV
jgi:fatty acid desaturase